MAGWSPPVALLLLGPLGPLGSGARGFSCPQALSAGQSVLSCWPEVQETGDILDQDSKECSMVLTQWLT